jgi:hypothetical protein
MSQEPLKECPSCSKNDLERLISGGGAVIIRGTKTPCFDKTKPPKEKKKKKEKYQPFWRQSGKINDAILKNPTKYIETGETE